MQKKPYYSKPHKPNSFVVYEPKPNQKIPGKWYVFSEHIDSDEDGRYYRSSIHKGPFETLEDARKFCKEDEFEIPRSPFIMEEKFSKFVGKLLEGNKIELDSGKTRDFKPRG
jgi:hypothetical protein